MIRLETHSIHLHCVGFGSPTVVPESDLDQYGSLSRVSVHDEIGEVTRLCSCDRSGILWSEPGIRPRDGETIARELGAVLDAAGEDDPYVVVRHAFGGAFVRIFAGQDRVSVCGMVLVESHHPEMLRRFEEYGVVPEALDRRIRPLILLLSHLGIPGRHECNPYDLPPEVLDAVQAFLPESSVTWFDEKVEAPNTLTRAGEHGYFGDLPLIVITTSKPPSSTADRGKVLHDLWLELQQELRLLNANNEIRIHGVGHCSQLRSPESVIDSIRDVVGRCEETSP